MKEKILEKWKQYDNIQQIADALDISRYVVKKILEDANIEYLKFFEDKLAKITEEKNTEIYGKKSDLIKKLSKYEFYNVFVYDDYYYYFFSNNYDKDGNLIIKNNVVRVVKSAYKGFIIRPIPIRSFDRLKKGADKDWTNVDYYINMFGKKISLNKRENNWFTFRSGFEAREIEWEKGVDELWKKPKQ